MNSIIHVCLISQQPIANLLPLLLEQPKKAIFLVTTKTKPEAERLKKVVKTRGINVECIHIDPFDFAGSVEQCTRVLAEHGENLVLNVTGGTKVTALAAFQSFFFADGNQRIIYLDMSRDRLLQLAPEEPDVTRHITNLISVRDYLSCYGVTITNTPPAEHQSRTRKKGLKKLCELLINNEKLLGRLNSHVSNTPTRQYATISLSELGNQAEELALILTECGVATRTRDACLQIPSEKDMFFCNGGWLEEYVFETIADLGIKGVKPLTNIEISWDGSGRQPTTNELDVLFCHRNRLHVISCKTSQLDRQTEDSTKGKEALYELDSLSNAAGGLFGKAMLCSARTVKKHTCDRARLQKIEIIDGSKLLQLHDLLKKWISQ